MKQVQLKGGLTLILRAADKDDAALVVDYLNKVGRESDNLTFGPDGYGAPPAKEAALIEAISKSDNQLMLCALLNGQLVGHLEFTGGWRPRTRHAGEFGITVLKEYWGKGIGSELLRCMITWARETGVIRKINLKVRSDNRRAIRLYEKFGFTAVGTITREFFMDGEFYDCLQMGMEID